MPKETNERKSGDTLPFMDMVASPDLFSDYSFLLAEPTPSDVPVT